jgi:hypothetical protein
MKRLCFVVPVLVALLASVALAQGPAQPPKPGPEQKRLNYFAGEWKTESDVKPSPFGPGGKVTSTDRGEWFPGGFFLVLHSDVSGAMGPVKSVAIFGYDPARKVYTYKSYDSQGMDETFTGAVEGDTWTWLSTSTMDGKTTKYRFIAKELSPTAYSLSFEFAAGDGAWTKVLEGKSTKVK